MKNREAFIEKAIAKEQALQAELQRLGHFALAYSGGVDSVYLLALAVRSGADVLPIQVISDFQPQFEIAEARVLARQIGAKLCQVELQRHRPEVLANPTNRCYYCKLDMLSCIQKAAFAAGYSTLLDGSNASDDFSERPGAQALAELAVRSPLREFGLGKAEIRNRSRALGLPTWSKAAYACLATRIPTGERLEPERLALVDNLETTLRELGFQDYRARLRGQGCLLQFSAAEQLQALARQAELQERLGKKLEWLAIDLKPREPEEGLVLERQAAEEEEIDES